MKIRAKVIFAFTVLALFVSLIVIDIYSFPNGYVGVTKKGGEGIGCVCHGINTPTPAVNVFFEGPDSVEVGGTVLYKIKIAHGPAVVGGFDAAVYSGRIDTVYTETGVRRDSATGDLTHSYPKAFASDTVYWLFKYTAPPMAQMDTLYAVGNSTNNDSTTSNDEWNFCSNFPVRVYNPIGIVNNSKTAEGYELFQNYPNPFNPSTKIRFNVKESGNVKLTVFDIRGRIVIVLINQRVPKGEYNVDFNAENFPGGVYFYKLESAGYSAAKKMVLLK
jgi:hypothetical protein